MTFQLHIFALHVLSLLALSKGQGRLSVRGRDLVLEGEKVFLSGVNQAWVNYARDFGHGDYNNSRPALIKTLDLIQSSGGNSMRIWLHIDGSSTPNFDKNGHVTGLDPFLVSDLIDLLTEARKRNILINLVLWNCAVFKKESRLSGLLESDSKLQSYIDLALRPLVRALRNNSGLGIWEIINEPEGCVAADRKSVEKCFDTTSLNILDFADWTGAAIPLQRLLRFIGRQTAAIHEEDPKALVTVGSWNYKTITDKMKRRNFYSDLCLSLASGVNNSGLDLYQIHTYSILGVYLPDDPFRVPSTNYSLTKPVIIGEFSQKKGGDFTSMQQYWWAYSNGYNGAWAWSVRGNDPASDPVHVLELGMRELRGRHNQSAGGTVNFIIPSDRSYISEFYRLLYSLFDFISSFISFE